MRGLKTLRSARTIVAGHAFIQNLRRGHYELVPCQATFARNEIARSSSLSVCRLRQAM